MKAPAVAMAAAFAGGIALGLSVVATLHSSLPKLLVASLLFSLAFLGTGTILALRARPVLAGLASLLCWVSLGFAAAMESSAPRASNHVVSLAERGKISLKTPLRWHGRLRDEPSALPWGTGIEIGISGVEFEGQLLAATGGMRLSYTKHESDEPLPELHAGDEVVVVTEARLPQTYRDEGAFDRRAYLAREGVDVVAGLRAPALIERVAPATGTASNWIAGTRRRLRKEVDTLFAATPQVAGVLRAMLLGDRSFVDRDEAVAFQKTGVFHVLVVAGLHVGALATFLFWAGRKLRVRREWAATISLGVLLAYVAVVEQRTPVMRAALMAAIVVLGGFLYRRLDLLNSAGLAALILLVANPAVVMDSSFRLSFLAIGCIAGLAVPWLEKTAQPYVRALRGWRDVTRDAAHEPRVMQFRLDLRSTVKWLAGWLPANAAAPAENSLVAGIAISFRVWELCVLSVVLQIGMAPMMASDFHRIALAGPFANLLAVPLTGIIVPVGFFTLGTGFVFPAVARLLAIPLTWVTLLLLRSMEWLAHFPRSSYRIPGPPLWASLMFFLCALALATSLRLRFTRGRTITRVAALGMLTTAVVIASYPFAPLITTGKLELSVLDVGQGDALFVVSPGGRTMLIDGGGAFGGFPGHEEHRGSDPGEDAVSPYLWWRGFKKLDVVAVTHAHQDHIGGLTAILHNFRVGSLWIGRQVSTAALARLEEEAAEMHIPIQHESRGQGFEWSGVQGTFLWPELEASPIARGAKNSDSLVLKLRYGKRTLLLPGDAEKDAERTMLAENDEEALRADVLKVGHHGSKNSTTAEFLAAVQPSVALISAGEDNPYGHPNPELLQRLQEAGARILRTDRDGAIHILTDGERLEIHCFNGCTDGAREAESAAEKRQGPAPQRDQNGEQ